MLLYLVYIQPVSSDNILDLPHIQQVFGNIFLFFLTGYDHCNEILSKQSALRPLGYGDSFPEIVCKDNVNRLLSQCYVMKNMKVQSLLLR